MRYAISYKLINNSYNPLPYPPDQTRDMIKPGKMVDIEEQLIDAPSKEQLLDQLLFTFETVGFTVEVRYIGSPK